MPRWLYVLYKRSFIYLKELFAKFWHSESNSDKKLHYFGVSLNVKIVTSLSCHNNKFTRYTKFFFLNTYTWTFLKIHSIPNPPRNHKETFFELDYIEKNEKEKNLPFSDLVFNFLVEFHFLWMFPSLSETATFILEITFNSTGTRNLRW